MVATFPCGAGQRYKSSLATVLELAGLSPEKTIFVPEAMASLLCMEKKSLLEFLPNSSILHVVDIGKGTVDFIAARRLVAADGAIHITTLSYDGLDHGGEALDRRIVAYLEMSFNQRIAGILAHDGDFAAAWSELQRGRREDEDCPPEERAPPSGLLNVLFWSMGYTESTTRSYLLEQAAVFKEDLCEKIMKMWKQKIEAADNTDVNEHKTLSRVAEKFYLPPQLAGTLNKYSRALVRIIRDKPSEFNLYLDPDERYGINIQGKELHEKVVSDYMRPISQEIEKIRAALTTGDQALAKHVIFMGGGGRVQMIVDNYSGALLDDVESHMDAYNAVSEGAELYGIHHLHRQRRLESIPTIDESIPTIDDISDTTVGTEFHLASGRERLFQPWVRKGERIPKQVPFDKPMQISGDVEYRLYETRNDDLRKDPPRTVTRMGLISKIDLKPSRELRGGEEEDVQVRCDVGHDPFAPEFIFEDGSIRKHRWSTVPENDFEACRAKIRGLVVNEAPAQAKPVHAKGPPSLGAEESSSLFSSSSSSSSSSTSAPTSSKRPRLGREP